MNKNKNTTQKQEVVSKKPIIDVSTLRQAQGKASFNFKKPLFDKRGPSFKTAFKTQNRGGK